MCRLISNIQQNIMVMLKLVHSPIFSIRLRLMLTESIIKTQLITCSTMDIILIRTFWKSLSCLFNWTNYDWKYLELSSSFDKFKGDSARQRSKVFVNAQYVLDRTYLFSNTIDKSSRHAEMIFGQTNSKT